LIRGNGAGLKILGGGELKHGLTVEADKISASAREKIEKAGGTVTMRPKAAAYGPRVDHVPAAAADTSEPETAAAPKAKAAKKTSSKKKAPAKAKAKKKSSGKS
jgi:large subunit ribosomal protein L15